MKYAAHSLLALSIASCGQAPERMDEPRTPVAPPLACLSPAPPPVTASAPSTKPSARPQPAPPRAPTPLPAGTVVLHVGDSMADALGKDLKRELEARGIKNVLKYKEATYIPQWAGYSMGLGELLAFNNPDLVIVTLGGNEVAMPDPNVRADAVRQIVQMIGDRPCIWIGAPLWEGAPNTGILEVIRKSSAPCRYVDTNALLPDLKRLGDKVHPTIPERRRWARYMIRWLELNRDPSGDRPWRLHQELLAPPPEPDPHLPP